MLTVDYNEEKKLITLGFAGRMDTQTTHHVNELLDVEPVMKNRRGEEQIVIDLNEVEYVASAFIRTCVRIAQEAGPGRFAIIHCQPFVKKTFKISGLDEVLNIS